MFAFGAKSERKLATCHSDLMIVMTEVMRITPMDFTVTDGHRSIERQQQLFDEDRTTIDGITRLSKHNAVPSLAVDIAPWPIDWQDRERFYFLAGIVLGVASKFDIALRWGGDWDGDGSWKDQSFDDLPHFELQQE